MSARTPNEYGKLLATIGEQAAEITQLTKNALADFNEGTELRAEVARLTEANAAHVALLRSVRLYIDWRYVTKQLTTPQKTLFADALDADTSFDDKADRWWLAGEGQFGTNGPTGTEAEPSVPAPREQLLRSGSTGVEDFASTPPVQETER